MKIGSFLDYYDEAQESVCWDLGKYTIEHKERLKEEFKENLKNIIEKIEEEKKDVFFISYTLLRVDVLNKKYEFTIKGYDKDWYYGKQENLGTYKADELFKFYEEHLKDMIEGNEEVWKVKQDFDFRFSNYELERLVLKQIWYFIDRIIGVLAKESVQEFIEAEEKSGNNIREKYEIHMGEYMGNIDVLSNEFNEEDEENYDYGYDENGEEDDENEKKTNEENEEDEEK